MNKAAIRKMEEKSGQVAAFLGGLSSPHRLRILCRLAEGEKNVTRLIEETGIAQTSMSQHLSKLKEEGIVTFRREHRELYYSISHPLALELMEVLHRHYCSKKGSAL